MWVNFSSIKGVIISDRMGTFARISLDRLRINKQLLGLIREECMTNYDGVCAKIKRPVIKGQLFEPDGMLNFPAWHCWNGENVLLCGKQDM